MFGSFSESLLDDFLLTYPVFMSTSDLCQALLGQYPFLILKAVCVAAFILVLYVLSGLTKAVSFKHYLHI